MRAFDAGTRNGETEETEATTKTGMGPFSADTKCIAPASDMSDKEVSYDPNEQLGMTQAIRLASSIRVQAEYSNIDELFGLENLQV